MAHDMAGVWTPPSCPHPYPAPWGPPRPPPTFGELWAASPCVSQSLKSAPCLEVGAGPRMGNEGLPVPQLHRTGLTASVSLLPPPARAAESSAHQCLSSTEMPANFSSTRLSRVMGTAMDSQARLSQGGLWDVKSTGPEDGGRGICLLILYCVWLCSLFCFIVLK